LDTESNSVGTQSVWLVRNRSGWYGRLLVLVRNPSGCTEVTELVRSRSGWYGIGLVGTDVY